ncbi:MAG: Glycosyl transferases group 1 [Candidatus Argoarchaeum ethanivorans]|uniref:Glycosyl transferases group 1 n=1 Tax=Candidatus Argoarchaeum ethanivorans TaxID=2608793 RepID=A0A811T6G3_9EURY|nr:MAG: Glycosyl transferases group 1 [Candidatus Argoarchaeum ethanivorans]
MKVCVIGDFSENLDEGLKNLAHYITDYIPISADFQLLKANVKNIISVTTFREIKKFHPDIIHYVPGPTDKSFLLLKIIKIYLKYNFKVVLSAPHPMFSDATLKLLNFKPDYVFASHKNLKERVESLDIPSHLLPNGVDVEKFMPISDFEKRKLREKYDIQKDRFTILHVGHLIANRNLEIFTKLSKENQVIIVASKYIGANRKLLNNLRDAGCIIFQGYFPNIEEFYQLSDCYLFPVKKGDSILCPLSVMEAMSCNLPVATTEFEGLKTFFEEGNGLIFAKKEDELIDGIESIKKGNISIATREKVEQYAWQGITKEIMQVYKDLMD